MKDHAPSETINLNVNEQLYMHSRVREISLDIISVSLMRSLPLAEKLSFSNELKEEHGSQEPRYNKMPPQSCHHDFTEGENHRGHFRYFQAPVESINDLVIRG